MLLFSHSLTLSQTLFFSLSLLLSLSLSLSPSLSLSLGLSSLSLSLLSLSISYFFPSFSCFFPSICPNYFLCIIVPVPLCHLICTNLQWYRKYTFLVLFDNIVSISSAPKHNETLNLLLNTTFLVQIVGAFKFILLIYLNIS